MKKIPKIIGVLTLFLSIFIGFGGLFNRDVLAVNDDATASVTLHKKKMTALPDLTQNTGEEMAHFDQYDDYEMGAEFDVYDVTDRFYTERAAGKTVEEAFQAINNTPTGLTPVRNGITDVNGLLTFELNKKSGGRDAVYLFVESAIPGGIRAENFLLSFPVYALDAEGEYTDRELNDIHLYPKNVVDADGRLLVTKRGSANNETLNGAKFIIQSDQTDRYLSGAINGMFTWSANRADAYEFETGFSYSIGSTGIVRTDSAVNHGELGILGFEPGNYRLIETVAPTGAAMIDDETINDFTITAKQSTATTVDVLNDTIEIHKGINADDRDFNVGDLIPYTGLVNIPVGIGDMLADEITYKHPALVITDVPVVGLQFNNDLTLMIDGDTFVIDPAWLNTDGNGFVLTIPASALIDFAGMDLSLAYNMYLDGSAVPDIGYNNEIFVETDLLEDKDETEDVFTGGKRFVKVDANFVGDNNTLAGATFVVRNSDDVDAMYLVIGNDNAVSWVADIASATEFTSNADGSVLVSGLEYGTYFLEETVAPEDYVLLGSFVEFTVSEGSYAENLVLSIANVRKGRLPSTGGTGIMGIVGVGVLLVLTTGGYYYKRQQDA